MSSSDDRSPQLIAVVSVSFSIALLSAGIRTFTRLRLSKWLGVDDALILCSAATAVAASVATIIGTSHGLGRHVGEQLPEWREPYAKCALAATLSYTLSTMFVKLSILSFYFRLTSQPAFRMATYAVIFLSAGLGISGLLIVGLQCIPISMLWDPTQTGHCVALDTFYFASIGLHILSEVLIYLLPIHALLALHLSPRQKLGLCGLMSLGAILIAISCYRIITVKDLLESGDITWSAVPPLMWCTVELGLAIFIACGPAFLAFFRYYMPRDLSGSANKGSHGPSRHQSSFPLGSVGRTAPQRDKSGIETMVTAVDRPYSGNENNGSKEMIIASTTGIQKQVDVWIENEDVEGGKSDSTSNSFNGV